MLIGFFLLSHVIPLVLYFIIDGEA